MKRRLAQTPLTTPNALPTAIQKVGESFDINQLKYIPAAPPTKPLANDEVNTNVRLNSGPDEALAFRMTPMTPSMPPHSRPTRLPTIADWTPRETSVMANEPGVSIAK